MRGAQHRAVVGRHRSIGLGRFAAQVGAQPAAVKQRQAQRRADADVAAGQGQQAIQAQRVEADKADQVDVRVKLATGQRHVLRCSLHPPAGGHHIGASAQQVSTDALRCRQGLERGQARRDAVQRLRRLAAEGRQLVAGQHHLAVQGLDLGPHIGQAALGQALLHHRVQPGLHPLLGQAQLGLALGQGALGNVTQAGQPGQAHPGPRHVGRQQHPGGLQVGLGRLLLAQRGLQRGVMLAEKIQLDAGIELQVGAAQGSAAQRRRVNATFGVALADHVQPQAGLRALGATGGVQPGTGAGQPGGCGSQAGLAGQGLVDQPVQRRVTQRLPPLRTGEGGADVQRQAGSGCRQQCQRCRQPAGRGAAGQQRQRR